MDSNKKYIEKSSKSTTSPNIVDAMKVIVFYPPGEEEEGPPTVRFRTGEGKFKEINIGDWMVVEGGGRRVTFITDKEFSERFEEIRSLIRKCPSCGKDSFFIFEICPTCVQSEGGRFKVLFTCPLCNFREKSKETIVWWLDRMGIDYRLQSKESLGIKTLLEGETK